MNMGDIMNDENEFINRLVKLRHSKNVSARDMSLSLGQSESYINKIENHKALPSLTGFFYICDYFEITPSEFFDYEADSPTASNELMNEIKKLNHTEAAHVIEIVKDINRNHSK